MKRIAIEKPNDILCTIVDGMDQNATMVPKFRQPVKGFEGRYMKTHLCEVLVHGLCRDPPPSPSLISTFTCVYERLASLTGGVHDDG